MSALQLALEYLKMAKLYGPPMAYANTTIDEAIAAIKAEAAQEPCPYCWLTQTGVPPPKTDKQAVQVEPAPESAALRCRKCGDSYEIQFTHATPPPSVQVEPVAWMWEHVSKSGTVLERGAAFHEVKPTDNAFWAKDEACKIATVVTPLYATPRPAPELDRLRAINAAMLSALSRATHALEHVYAATPLRDLDETICECKFAITKATS